MRSSTRDRVRALGEQRRQSSDAVVATAIELLEKEMFWTAWQAAQESISPEEGIEEQAELAAWDRASSRDLQASEQADRAHR